MKKIFALLFIITSNTLFSQSFEGTLKYSTDIIIDSKMEALGITKDVIIDEMKKNGTWLDTLYITYKGGDYHYKTTNKNKTWLIYNSDSNNIYTVQDGVKNDYCSIIDASIDTEYTFTKKMPSVTKLDTVIKINDIECNIVRVKWKSGVYDYYYNPSILKVNPELYSKHIYDGWSEFLKISHSLPIKIEKKGNGFFTVTITLESINDHIVDDKLFLVPELEYDKEIKKMVPVPNQKIMKIKK